MATVAKNYSVYVDGANAGCVFKSHGAAFSQAEADATALCSTGSMAYEPGNKSSTFSLEGFYDYDATDSDGASDLIVAARNAGQNVAFTLGFTTPAAGELALVADGIVTSYEITETVGDLEFANLQLRGAGQCGYGAFFDAEATFDAETANTAVIDGGAASSNGGRFNVHLWLEADSTAPVDGVSFIIQHSTDNSVWTDLVASQIISGQFGGVSELIPVGTTINRYTRVRVTSDDLSHVVAAFVRF